MHSDTHTRPDTALRVCRALLVSLFVVAMLLVVHGYRFPGGDHYDEVPPILSMLHPELFRADYFVAEMHHFTPRTYYFALIYILTRGGLSVPIAHFLLLVLTLAPPAP